MSRKRTDLEGVGEDVFGERRNEEAEGIRGRVSFAWAKDEERDGSLGLLMEDCEVVGKPRNWEVRSSYWVRSCWDVSLRVDARVLLSVSGEIRAIWEGGQWLTSRPLLGCLSARSPMPRYHLAFDPAISICVHPENWALNSERWLFVFQAMIV